MMQHQSEAPKLLQSSRKLLAKTKALVAASQKKMTKVNQLLEEKQKKELSRIQ